MTKEEKEAVLHCLRAMIDEELCEECPLYGTTGTDHCEKDCVRLAIKELEQEPKTGHWIEVTNGRGGHECDICHKYAPSYQDGDEYLTNYCPNCGAKMTEWSDKE